MNSFSSVFRTISKEDHDFIKMECSNIEFVFSTARNGLNFNKSSEEGRQNIEKLKDWFSIGKVAYLNQIHSRVIRKADNNIYDGDALISNEKNMAIGVFTADCVPVLIADTRKKIVAAVHSGWKGTLNCIVTETIKKMKREYDVEFNNIVVAIGPHIESCCYEVGEEVISAFRSSEIYKEENIIDGRMLNLEECIRVQLKLLSVPENNIYSTGICTKCSKEYRMYSYRRHPDEGGRMFSFIIIR